MVAIGQYTWRPNAPEERQVERRGPLVNSFDLPDCCRRLPRIFSMNEG